MSKFVFYFDSLFPQIPQDPATAIPKGTLLAILTTCITYIIYPIMIGASMLRDATGDLALLQFLYDFINELFITINRIECVYL